MNGEIYTREDLEKMDSWRATFRHIFCVASAFDHHICLLKKPGVGYMWKTPNKPHVVDCNLESLQKALSQGRLELVCGKLPRKIKVPTPKFAKKKRRAVAV